MNKIKYKFNKEFPIEKIRLKKKGLTNREIDKILKDERSNIKK